MRVHTPRWDSTWRLGIAWDRVVSYYQRAESCEMQAEQPECHDCTLLHRSRVVEACGCRESRMKCEIHRPIPAPADSSVMFDVASASIKKGLLPWSNPFISLRRLKAVICLQNDEPLQWRRQRDPAPPIWTLILKICLFEDHQRAMAAGSWRMSSVGARIALRRQAAAAELRRSNSGRGTTFCTRNDGMYR